MEMDREDGTECVLSFAVDVNENRAEGCKTHTLQPLAQSQCVHRNNGFHSDPKSTVHSGANRATSEDAEVNGFPEPDGVIELSLELKGGESKTVTSGHIRIPDGGTGCFGGINPNLTQNRNLDCSDAHLTESGLINPANGDEVELWGFHGSPNVGEGAAGIGGTNGSLITLEETSETGGTHSSWCKSAEKAGVHGNYGPLTASGHINTSDADVWEFHASTLVIQEPSGNQTTSAETLGARRTKINWAVVGDAASTGESNGSLTASGTINASNGDDADNWEFHASPIVTGENVSTGEPNGNQGTFGEITGSPWACVIPIALVETSGTRGSNTVVQETVSIRGNNAIRTTSGTCVNMTAPEETTTTWRSNRPVLLNVVGEKADTGGSNGNLTASWETNGIQCTQVSSETLETNTGPWFEETNASLTTTGETAASRRTKSNPIVKEEMPGTREPDTSTSEADEMVDIGGTSARLSTSVETPGTRRTTASPVVEEKISGTCENNTSFSVAGETVSIGGRQGSLTTSGETAGTEGSNAGTFVAESGDSLPTLGNICSLTATTVTGEPVSMKQTGVSQVVAGPIDTPPLVDRVLPRDQVAGNPQLGNDATDSEFAIWENPDCQIHLRVCVGKGVSSCCTELEMKIPNGDVNCGKLQMDNMQHEGAVALDKGVRVGNCGYLVVNRRSISGTSSIPVYSIREPWTSTEQQQEVRSTSDIGPETISKLSIAKVNEEENNQKIETRPEYDVDFIDGVGAARPRTLRTDHGRAVSLSCDSTPLNDENAGYFIDDGGMDIIMNNLELGRRQSAPDKLQESEHIDPEPSDEQTVTKFSVGFSDFLTRYEQKATIISLIRNNSNIMEM